MFGENSKLSIIFRFLSIFSTFHEKDTFKFYQFHISPPGKGRESVESAFKSYSVLFTTLRSCSYESWRLLLTISTFNALTSFSRSHSPHRFRLFSVSSSTNSTMAWSLVCCYFLYIDVGEIHPPPTIFHASALF